MTAPKLKFKDITGNAHLNWRKVKLGEVTSLITKGTTPTSIGHAFQKHGVNFIKIESLSNNGSFIKNKFAYIDQETNSKLLRSQLNVGDVLFSIAGVIGRTAVVTPDILPANTNQALAIIRPKSKSILNSNFLHFILNSETVKKISQDASSQLAQANLSLGDLANLTLDLPTIDEQEKISSFLSSIDEKISLLTRKYELLNTYKKGVMQKIFNQDIRFKDDVGNEYADWEIVKLEEIAYTTTGSSNRIDSTLIGEYTFFDRSEDIRTSDKFLFDCEAVIVAGEGQAFTPKYFVGKFDLHQRAYAIMNFKESYGKYIHYHIDFHRDYLLSQAVGSTVKSLRLPMLNKMPIKLPCVEEQTKIANFLSVLDEKISNVQKQLELAKQYKQGLLQQMFI